LMKKFASAMLGLLVLGLWLPRVASVTDVDWLGRASLLGGAERQDRHTGDAVGSGSHALAQAGLLSVIPILPTLGMQFSFDYAHMFGHGNKFGAQAGPILGFGMGKVGVFVTDQFQLLPQPADGGGLRSANFVWITPSLALYDLLPNTNFDVWWSQQVSMHNRVDGKFGDGKHQLAPTSSLRTVLNWFPGFLPFGNGNTELSLGVQANGLSGKDKGHAGFGIGPVGGVSFMPWQNLEVQLFKVHFDDRNRYQVLTGVQFFFSKENAPLIALRRKYLEPTNMPQQINTKFRLD